MSSASPQDDLGGSSFDQLMTHTNRGGNIDLTADFVRKLDEIWKKCKSAFKCTDKDCEDKIGCSLSKLCNWRMNPKAKCGAVAVICCCLGKTPQELALEPDVCQSVEHYCHHNNLRPRRDFPWATLFPTSTNLSDVLDTVLARCDGYLSWIKPFHASFGLLFGGAVRTQVLEGDLSNLLQRIVFNPVDWVTKVPFPITPVPNCLEWVTPIVSEWSREVRERNLAYILQITKNVKSEIYVPINLSYHPVACLNIHFPIESTT